MNGNIKIRTDKARAFKRKEKFSANDSMEKFD